jgi:hypothetical protein
MHLPNFFHGTGRDGDDTCSCINLAGLPYLNLVVDQRWRFNGRMRVSWRETDTAAA